MACIRLGPRSETGCGERTRYLATPTVFRPIAVTPRRGGGLLLRAERQHAVGRLHGRGHLLGKRALERGPRPDAMAESTESSLTIQLGHVHHFAGKEASDPQ
eukprot:6322069-Prymnesium_polylepis.2